MPRLKGNARKRSLDPNEIPTRAKKTGRSLKASDAYGTKLPVQITQSVYPYKFGNIIITFNYLEEFINTDVFTIEFQPESTNCCLLWTEANEGNELQEKILPATCEIPYDILLSLSSMKIFYFVMNSHTLCTGNNTIQMYLNPASFISLQSASEPYFNHQRSNIFKVIKFFLQIEFDDYGDEYLHNHQYVNQLYDSIRNTYNPKIRVVPVSHDFLIPKLRQYQCQAVYWMIKCEKKNCFDASKGDLHELYAELNLEDGHTVYFHKYGGYFVNQKFISEKSCRGGVLADEMGLGKTVEVLSLILLNQRNPAEIQNSKEHSLKKILCDIPKNENAILETEKESFYEENAEIEEKVNDLQREQTDRFACVCGSENYIYHGSSAVKCITCNVIQHAECVMFNPNVPPDQYICPYCWISNSEPLRSSATLIISPESIIYQWEDEIAAHIKENCLKVFMYEGIEQQKFIDPSYLANHDIVLVSYETLKKELNHVDVPWGKSARSLRHRKKFMPIPSPLCAIEWWRICLDEAQTVESVSTKIAKMAGKLLSVNRWCVTGTPIKTSIEDLYGLLVFLGINPYHEKLWWKEVLWKPFVNGDTSHLADVINCIVWRTVKEEVMHQIGLPDLEVVVHKMEFSPIERVYYEKQHAGCKRDFMEKIQKFHSLEEHLCSMDKNILGFIMSPLKKLRLVCCHFQMTRGNVDVQKNKVTTTELLAHLLKTTRYECEDVHRKLVMALNGMAGIYIIKQEYQNAVQTYEKVLKSTEENSGIRTDATQQIHALFHLSNILALFEKHGKVIESSFSPLQLNTKMNELSQAYIMKHMETIEICIKSVNEVGAEISQIMSKFKIKVEAFPLSVWWAEILNRVKEDKRMLFLEKIEEILHNAPGQGFLRLDPLFTNRFSGSFVNFLTKLFEMSKDLYETRVRLVRAIQSISTEPNISTLRSAIACHLRPTGRSPKCVYCQAEAIFQLYETKLFRFDETVENESEENTVCFQARRRGSHADGDLELILKFLLCYSRRVCKDLTVYIEDGAYQLKLLDAFKKEFKILRNMWKKCFDFVSQKDEIEMAKITTRVLLPNEVPPNPPIPYILMPHDVQPKLVQYHSDVISAQFQMKKKLGKMFYLQNLEKVENKDAPFEEYCPVCQQGFENSWCVLQCGHCFCLYCMEQLLNNKSAFTNSLGFVCVGIRCPVCRQAIADSDVYIIDNKKDEDEFKIKGSYSVKAREVVKCLMEIQKKDPGAKSIVFSSFTDFLLIVERALVENDIKCFNFYKKKKKFQNHLREFKRSKDLNTLLIPLTLGCNGLNITEANHVLLLEPVFDTSSHLQAVSRVFRIGQKKNSIIHRFIVSKTVEESIHEVMEDCINEGSHVHLTINSLEDLFKEY